MIGPTLAAGNEGRLGTQLRVGTRTRRVSRHLAQGTEPPICRGSGVDPRSPANRGWGWGWTPDSDPRQIGGGKSGVGVGVDSGPPTQSRIPGKSGIGGGGGPPIVGVCRAARWHDVLVEVNDDATRLERIFCRASNGPSSDLLIRDIIRHVIVYRFS